MSKIKLNKTDWERIGKFAGWLDPDEMRSTIANFYDNSTKVDPSSPNFAVDMRIRKKLPANLRKKVNIQLSNLTRNRYFDTYPADEVKEILNSVDAIMVQEDGAQWSGFIGPTGECGDDKNRPFYFDIAFKDSQTGQYILSDSRLVTTLCIMPSGKLELVHYLS